MALPVANTAEGGSDETAVTTANSGGASGDAFNDVTASGAGGAIAFDSAHAAHGTLAYRITQASPASTQRLRWSTSIGSFTEIWGRTYFYRTAAPTSSDQLIRINNGSQTRQAYVLVGSSGDPKLYVADSTTAFTSGSVTIATNQWVRIEFHFIGNAVTGLIEAKLFNTADSTSPDETVTRSNVNTNTGTGASMVDFGMGVAVNASQIYWLDDLQVNGTGYPGPASAVFTGQTLLPDADNATGSWTTAPLFSKLNDSSDATIITNTAA